MFGFTARVPEQKLRGYTQHGKLTFFLAVRQINAGKLFRKSTESALLTMSTPRRVIGHFEYGCLGFRGCLSIAKEQDVRVSLGYRSGYRSHRQNLLGFNPCAAHDTRHELLLILLLTCDLNGPFFVSFGRLDSMLCLRFFRAEILQQPCWMMFSGMLSPNVPWYFRYFRTDLGFS